MVRFLMTPSSGDIEHSWDNLETTERGVEQHLMKELIR